jgi:hypothetical protein
LPPLTEAQAEALDAVHFIAAKHRLETSMREGDIRFINNLAVLHSREAYKDDETHKRHLVRLWLRNEELAWELPAPLKLAWARVFDDEERGERWDVEPVGAEGRALKHFVSCD